LSPFVRAVLEFEGFRPNAAGNPADDGIFGIHSVGEKEPEMETE